MRKHRVEFLRRAEDDLRDLYETIAGKAGLDVAEEYVARIEAACLSLELSPLRGTKRDDILSGLRTIGFERRATIVFRVRGSKVTIIRIFHGGRSFERALLDR